MIASRFGMRISTEYKMRDHVLVRYLAKRPRRQRKKQYHRFITSVPNKVVETQPNQYRYQVKFYQYKNSTTNDFW